ncbi:metallophosphoesterase [Nakamurella sp. YIM 132087]|uniref:Metallophosphoesterase n=2 Tax=Nakamurella alba TaxID=2665158 RepID=A0A7K1FRR3_9ACTN|nr:metallophosphoesterase [Nakamurella alba]
MVTVVLLLLHGVPWWLLVLAPTPPTWLIVAGTVLFGGAVVLFPLLMVRGHGRHHDDRAARLADTWLGLLWQLFSWSVIGSVVSAVLAVAGVGDPGRSRWIAAIVAGWVAVQASWGGYQAMRVPRVRTTEVRIPRLPAALDGLRLVAIADTHFGPIDRSRWSSRVVDVVNGLSPDLVVHVGDFADGSTEARASQSEPLGRVSAPLGRFAITGNHEYMSGAVAWSERMTGLGWTMLHNAHVVLESSGARLVLAGVDDRTAARSGVSGHGADHRKALSGVDPALPVVLLAHQPRQVADAVAHGVDLQISGHTHGGQIWPFHLIVRAEQKALQGLSRVSDRTQLYVSRGTGFWGPPFRVFAPSEITVLVLRSA